MCDDKSNCTKFIIPYGDKGNIIFYNFFKSIPNEKYKHSYYFDRKNELKKYWNIRSYSGYHKELVLYRNSTQEKILRISIPNYYIKSSEIPNLEWSSFKSICKLADKIYILDEIENDYLYYHRSELNVKPYIY